MTYCQKHADRLLDMSLLDRSQCFIWPLKVLRNMKPMIDTVKQEAHVEAQHMKTDVKTGPDEYVMTIDTIPGISKSDVKVKVENHIMTISFERNLETDNTLSGKERFYGRVTREFKLPNDALESGIKAHYANCVLTLNIPRSNERRQTRMIPILGEDHSSEVTFSSANETATAEGDERSGAAPDLSNDESATTHKEHKSDDASPNLSSNGSPSVEEGNKSSDANHTLDDQGSAVTEKENA